MPSNSSRSGAGNSAGKSKQSTPALQHTSPVLVLNESFSDKGNSGSGGAAPGLYIDLNDPVTYTATQRAQGQGDVYETMDTGDGPTAASQQRRRSTRTQSSAGEGGSDFKMSMLLKVEALRRRMKGLTAALAVVGLLALAALVYAASSCGCSDVTSASTSTDASTSAQAAAERFSRMDGQIRALQSAFADMRTQQGAAARSSKLPKDEPVGDATNATSGTAQPPVVGTSRRCIVNSYLVRSR